MKSDRICGLYRVDPMRASKNCQLASAQGHFPASFTNNRKTNNFISKLANIAGLKAPLCE